MKVDQDQSGKDIPPFGYLSYKTTNKLLIHNEYISQCLVITFNYKAPKLEFNCSFFDEIKKYL
ncbi:hypothetical protein VIN01S_10900 [Vibrio inusitatus NBRC 102082]|uniref:Uncharacterized protein n=1 Tax=Vibrio inusitatus NBRC 102082 TaxID=1219070 RepID=A0A4Y3HT72_9VIBR|nr:hypothetical protein VIN01S_10900 [Vibrio inusitatus NBRC 102082]